MNNSGTRTDILEMKTPLSVNLKGLSNNHKFFSSYVLQLIMVIKQRKSPPLMKFVN